MPSVRVAISTPVVIVRAGLVAMLDGGGARTRVVPLPGAPRAGGLRGAGEASADDAPEVILYDAVGLFERDGADLDLFVTRSPARVLVLSRDLRPDLATRALARGADGSVPMGVGADELVEAVERAARGERVGTDDGPGSGGSAPLERDLARETRLGAELGLTPREVEVLALVARGLSNADIAAATYLSVNSVKTYVRGAYRRIGVHNRSQAVIWCLQHGFTGSR